MSNYLLSIETIIYLLFHPLMSPRSISEFHDSKQHPDEYSYVDVSTGLLTVISLDASLEVRQLHHIVVQFQFI